MITFNTFFLSGWEHIVDINAYDHILFVMTLCAAFKLKEWKQILIIITAFTIGHSGTLILSAFDIIPTNAKLIDLLIPFTIMLTAIANVINYNKNKALIGMVTSAVIFVGVSLLTKPEVEKSTQFIKKAGMV